jgi:hypothetical protein
MSTTSGRWCRARWTASLPFSAIVDDVDRLIAGEDRADSASQQVVVVDEHHAHTLGHRCARDRGGWLPIWCPLDREVDVETAGALSLDQGGDLVDAWQRRAVHLPVVAEETDDVIDLLDRLASEVLDRRHSLRRALAIALAQHARSPRLHQDGVEGVSGRVMELAGDPGALFGDDDLVLAPSVIHLVGDTGAEDPAPVTDQPRAGPDQPGVWSSVR